MISVEEASEDPRSIEPGPAYRDLLLSTETLSRTIRNYDEPSRYVHVSHLHESL